MQRTFEEMSDTKERGETETRDSIIVCVNVFPPPRAAHRQAFDVLGAHREAERKDYTWQLWMSSEVRLYS